MKIFLKYKNPKRKLWKVITDFLKYEKIGNRRWKAIENDNSFLKTLEVEEKQEMITSCIKICQKGKGKWKHVNDRFFLKSSEAN